MYIYFFLPVGFGLVFTKLPQTEMYKNISLLTTLQVLSLLPGGFNYIKSENKLCVEVKIKSRQKLFEELAKK